MFKSKLQEYCQSRMWILPEYGVTREGLDHCPRWKGEVVVNGVSFTTPEFCRSIKEAQNLAAKLALEHLSATTPASTSTQLLEVQVTSSNGASRVTEDNKGDIDNKCSKCKYEMSFAEVSHMYKAQLQTYAQKRNVALPVYSFERVGPCHASRFRSKVTLEGTTYESEEFYHTVKDAENAAAKVALASVIPEGTEKDDLSMYKNLLQEFLQKEYSCLPNYTTVRRGQPHCAIFASTVEIQGETFRGQEARSKKQAEMNVAKVAYISLRERKVEKDDNKLIVVGAAVEVMESSNCSSVDIPVIGATNSLENATIDALSMSDEQMNCVEGKIEKDDKLIVVGAADEVVESSNCSSVDIPVVGATNSLENATIGALPMSDEQMKCVEAKDLEATPPTYGSTPNPEVTSLVPEPIYYPNNASISITDSSPVGGESSSNKKKMKNKILVLPQSTSSNLEYLNPMIHNQMDLRVPVGPITRAPANNSGQLASPDSSVCALQSSKKWSAFVLKE